MRIFCSFLSRKSFLLKSVSNAVVNYTINCFRIPKLFWVSWALFKVDIGGGHKLHDKRGICLGRWTDICAPVQLGGLGIRSLSQLHKCFLTKLACRIVASPSSLFFRLFDAKYNKRKGCWSAETIISPKMCTASEAWR